MANWRGKTELVEKDRKWVSCVQARRQGRLWSTAGANCVHLINQSMTVSSCKARVLPKKRYRIGSYQWQIRFIELPQIEDWISLRSGYHDLILKDALYREQVGRVWKWVILLCVGSKQFLTCLRQCFFYTLSAFDYFFSNFNLIIYPPAILPSSQNWEKARREWQFWLEGQLMMV